MRARRHRQEQRQQQRQHEYLVRRATEVAEENVSSKIAGVGAKRSPERYERHHLKTSSDTTNAGERETASGWSNVLWGLARPDLDEHREESKIEQSGHGRLKKKTPCFF